MKYKTSSKYFHMLSRVLPTFLPTFCNFLGLGSSCQRTGLYTEETLGTTAHKQLMRGYLEGTDRSIIDSLE